ncbi:MAG: hypothetical protein K2X47_16875, partial [Bdellovibrionales bacterium]|nr:hypothetical protein [Bdellovibrionales bacterium]
NLHVTVTRGKDAIKNLTWNLTDFAQARPVTSAKEAAIVAFHEIGHALVNDPMLTGQKLAFITIIPSSQNGINSLGYARYEDFSRGKTNLDIEGVVASVGRMMAGSLAQQMAGFSRDSGWSNDLLKIRKLIASAIIEWGLIDELLAVRLDKDDQPILTAKQSEILAAKTEEIILLAKFRTQKFLKANWGLVRALTAELLRTGNMPGQRFDEIREALSQTQSVSSSGASRGLSCSGVVRGSQLAKPGFAL